MTRRCPPLQRDGHRAERSQALTSPGYPRSPTPGHDEAAPAARRRRGHPPLHVLPPLRIQPPSSLRTTTIPRTIRLRRTIPPAHQRVRIPRRRLQVIPLRTRRTSRTLLAARPLLTRRTRPALRTCRPRRTSRARGAGRTRLPDTGRSVVARAPRRTRRANRTRRPGLPTVALLPLHPRRTRHGCARLPAAPRRPGHRCATHPLHLPGESITRRPLLPQIPRLVHECHGEDSEQTQREEPGHRADPLGTRQPHPPPTPPPGPGHFATTAQTAIAAHSRPIRTGTII